MLSFFWSIMGFHHILISSLIIIFIHRSASKQSPDCVKYLNDSGLFKPYFKTKRICIKNSTYILKSFGDQFDFDCAYDSNPESQIYWYKHDATNNKIEPIKSLNNTVNFFIPKVSITDEGFYTCFITNRYGNITHTFYLAVNDNPIAPPIFNHKSELITGAKGEKQILDCTYKTDEYASFNFYKANNLNNHTFDQLNLMNDNEARSETVLQLIDSNRTFTLIDQPNSSNYSSIIDNLNDESFGIYMCIAESRYGKSLKFIKLTEATSEFNYFIILYIVLSFIILLFLIIFEINLRIRDKNKLMIEKNYIIRKRIIIDYVDAKRERTNGNYSNSIANSNTDFESNFYENFAVIPRVEIVKERKEIVEKKLSNELNNNEDFFEMDLDPEWEIDRNCLKFDETIGSGNFGVVQRAFLFKLPLTPSLNNSRPNYINDSMFTKGDQIDSLVEYTNVNQPNYNYIIDHFHNNNLNNNIKTAFINNYYGKHQDLLQFGSYGRIDLLGCLRTEGDQLEEQGRVVAVKKLRQDYSEHDLKNFISEMVMMKMYGNHRNIINLIGTCTQASPFYVIMEYAERGNLKDFLKKYRFNNYYLPSNLPKARLTSSDLISFALQIAHGMHHLASLHCIHRDLAARNVLVTSNLQMKIADFGLSRNTGDSEYYRKSSDTFVPIKWLAPECISQQLYTIQTDVWSYAVTLWELTSLGDSPYENVDPKEMFLYLKDGKRLNRPFWCNEAIYCLMLDCWNWNPKHRPLFDKLIQYLELLFEYEFENSYDIHEDQPPQRSINFESESLLLI